MWTIKTTLPLGRLPKRHTLIFKVRKLYSCIGIKKIVINYIFLYVLYRNVEIYPHIHKIKLVRKIILSRNGQKIITIT